MAEGWFRDVVRDYVEETGTAARQLAIWAGLTDSAEQNWSRGKSTPKHPNLLRLVAKLPEKWRERFVEAWDRDNTPSHVWSELQSLRAAARVGSAPSPAALKAEQFARELTPDESEQLVGFLDLLRMVPWRNVAKPLVAQVEAVAVARAEASQQSESARRTG